ncbi:MAG: gamma-glutamyl-gamma-aminobutyrate hydrolase family protein [Alphaproteobacteria bacterium]|nr:gamma-glutamyl-gamma-aminobutyrate hydrolase family protein [Alphaproteobacteria bacterium]
MAKRPLIGVTLDYQESGSFSKRPHHALRCAYFDAIVAAGGLPAAIPYQSSVMADYLDRLDGLVVPGGTFAFPDEWYVDTGERPYKPSPRLAFDMAIIDAALRRDMPVLGICAGMQELAAHAGAKMVRNVHAMNGKSIDHLNERPAEEFAHEVAVAPGNRLASIVGAGALPVNTAHVEAVVEPPADLRVTALAPDGVIEAIELPRHRFAIGVQWHPEFFREKGSPHRALFEALVAESGR